MLHSAGGTDTTGHTTLWAVLVSDLCWCEGTGDYARGGGGAIMGNISHWFLKRQGILVVVCERAAVELNFNKFMRICAPFP